MGRRALVLAHDLTSLGRAHGSGAVTLVGDLSMAGGSASSASHLPVERVPRLLGVDGHLVQKHLLHAGTSTGVVRTDLRHVGLTGRHLSGDFLLNRIEVLDETDTPAEVVTLAWNVSDDPASLLHVEGDDLREVLPPGTLNS